MTAKKRKALTAEEKAAGYLIEKIGGPERGKWYAPAARPLPPVWVLTLHGRSIGVFASLATALESAALEFAEAHQQSGGRARRPAARRKNPSVNDPNLTVETLRLKRIGPGHYEHVNKATGTTWWILHLYGEYRGEDRWVFMRSDHAVGSSSEGTHHDDYATKRDAAEALVDRLRHRDEYLSYARMF